MKKQAKLLLSAFLAVVMLFTFLPVGNALAASSGKCGDNLTWTLDDNGTLTISGTGEMYDWDYDDMPPWWGEYVKNVKTAVIENGVTSIGDKAFYYCEALTNITIPNSVTSIGTHAFENCNSLTSITIPSSVVNIGYIAFAECDNLTSITVAKDNTAYSSLNGVLFNKDKTELIKYPAAKADDAYSIPNGVTDIGDFAFFNCQNMKSITIPNSVTDIGNFTFFNCQNMKSIIIPSSVTYIGEYAVGCYEVYNEEMGYYLITKIADFIIYGQKGSTAEEYANNNGIRFKLICSHSSESYTEFDEVPATCAENGYTAGVYCNECDSWISGHELIQAHHTDSNSDGICDICGGETELSIRVDERKTVEITAGEITYIKFVPEVSGEYTFTSHSNDDTYSYLFDGNKGKIASDDDDGEHNNFSITADLEAGKTYYWGATYLDDDKSGSFEVSLTKSSDSDKKSGKCGDNLTWTLDDNGTLTIGGTGEMYGWDYDDTPWYDYNDSIKSAVIENGVTSIGDYTFTNCDLTDIIIPDSVRSIGQGAFSLCYELTNITIGNNVKSIGDYAFMYCSLTSVIIPDSVTIIGDSAFLYCGLLTNVIIGNSVRSIGESAFNGCDDLTSITIPSSVTNIASKAFVDCYNLTSITILNRTASIGDKAFGYNYDSNAMPVKKDNFKVFGYSGSTAEKYAKDNGFKFVDLSHTHSYKSAVTKKATCTADGVMTYTCSCGDKYTKVIKATGHKYTTSTVKATQTKDGSTVTKCTVCGAVRSKTVIAKASSVKLSKTSFTYNGKTQKPSVTVKDSKGKTLKNGTDYTVKYSSGCKNVGQYTVTITFKGKYSGTKTLTFKIVPKGTSISKLSSGKKQFTAKWSKQTTQTTGYELQYSTKSSMSGAKTVTVGKNKTTSSTVKKLKSGKKYYVRIRTYKTVRINGKSVKLYSSWSNVKSVKTK